MTGEDRDLMAAGNEPLDEVVDTEILRKKVLGDNENFHGTDGVLFNPRARINSSAAKRSSVAGGDETRREMERR